MQSISWQKNKNGHITVASFKRGGKGLPGSTD
jgi:hypothetical protein